MLCESLLISDTQITPGGEEASENACSRLHQAVDMLLELLNQANKQVKKKKKYLNPLMEQRSTKNIHFILLARRK